MAIALPAIPAAVVIATGGSAAPFSPPFICAAKNVDVLFYTIVPPGCLIYGTGISLVATILLVLVRRTKYSQQKECAEEKVITLDANQLLLVHHSHVLIYKLPLAGLEFKSKIYEHQTTVA